MDPVAFVNKWLHLTSIVTVLGGTIIAAVVFYPLLSKSESNPTLVAVWKRFEIVLAISWVVVLLSGFLNLYLVSPKVNSGYQMLAGMKMMAAFIMFIVTMLIGHPVPAIKKFFANKGAWYTMIAILGIVVLALSAQMNMSRVSGSGLKQPKDSTVAR